jgi:hypothetical protein
MDAQAPISAAQLLSADHDPLPRGGLSVSCTRMSRANRLAVPSWRVDGALDQGALDAARLAANVARQLLALGGQQLGFARPAVELRQHMRPGMRA